MLTADEAKTQTKENIENKILDELVMAETRIKKAVEEGQFDITVENLSEQAQDRLRALGYEVHWYASGNNESSIIISWK